jgi:transcriptional regulator with XRE-family HTH domain
MPTRLGRHLQRLREARDLSRAEVAARAGLSREYIRKLEAGRQDPTVGVLQKIARALKVKASTLLE